VIDAQTNAILQTIVRREGRSLLQYMSDAYPWTTSGEEAELTRVQRMIEEEQRAAADLVRLLTRARLTPPYLASYPAGFTTLNYVSLDNWLPRLVDYELQTIAALQTELTEIRDAEARVHVQKLLDVKQRHLQTLKGMAAAHPLAVAAH
jgi:hypothetical protein